MKTGCTVNPIKGWSFFVWVVLRRPYSPRAFWEHKTRLLRMEYFPHLLQVNKEGFLWRWNEGVFPNFHFEFRKGFALIYMAAAPWAKVIWVRGW